MPRSPRSMSCWQPGHGIVVTRGVTDPLRHPGEETEPRGEERRPSENRSCVIHSLGSPSLQSCLRLYFNMWTTMFFDFKLYWRNSLQQNQIGALINVNPHLCSTDSGLSFIKAALHHRHWLAKYDFKRKNVFDGPCGHIKPSQIGPQYVSLPALLPQWQLLNRDVDEWSKTPTQAMYWEAVIQGNKSRKRDNARILGQVEKWWYRIVMGKIASLGLGEEALLLCRIHITCQSLPQDYLSVYNDLDKQNNFHPKMSDQENKHMTNHDIKTKQCTWIGCQMELNQKLKK